MTEPGLSIAIPTFGREAVLLETIRGLLGLPDRAEEIVVLDQTVSHEGETERQLAAWSSEGTIRWLRLPRPSIPAAMNEGLRQARRGIVLFVDDDVIPLPGLVEAHRRAHDEKDVSAVVGMVLQPGEEPTEGRSFAPRREGLRRDLDFSFRTTERTDVWNVMAGNLSVKRTEALVAGGFDERFVGVAYRFETEFCRRLRRSGGRVVYEPAAAIRHLKAPSGGTRFWGHHRTSARPEHSVGDYYFALREGNGLEAVSYVLRRLRQETLSRYHLTHPWFIPVKAVGEVRGLLMALRLVRGREGGK